MDRGPHLLKRDVRYRQGSADKHCGNCVMFRPSARLDWVGACDLVIGLIAGNKVCDRWEAREDAE
jgi:hypothetical protein